MKSYDEYIVITWKLTFNPKTGELCQPIHDIEGVTCDVSYNPETNNLNLFIDDKLFDVSHTDELNCNLKHIARDKFFNVIRELKQCVKCKEVYNKDDTCPICIFDDLNNPSTETCVVCMESIMTPITICGDKRHCVCKICHENIKKSHNTGCPLCRSNPDDTGNASQPNYFLVFNDPSDPLNQVLNYLNEQYHPNQP